MPNDYLDQFHCVNQYEARGLFTCKFQNVYLVLTLHDNLLAYILGKASFWCGVFSAKHGENPVSQAKHDKSCFFFFVVVVFFFFTKHDDPFETFPDMFSGPIWNDPYDTHTDGDYSTLHPNTLNIQI